MIFASVHSIKGLTRGSYSTIAWGASVDKGRQPDVEYGYKSHTTGGTMPICLLHRRGPLKGPMLKGVIVAYAVIALCYLPVALVGYYIFGNRLEDNILLTLQAPTWLIAMANMFVVVHLIGSYQKLMFRPTWHLRLITRTTYVAFTMFIAITFPFFNGLLAFFGGFAFAPTTYFLPCIIWLIICKPKKFSLSWFANWVLFVELNLCY
ncbi:lysine histidine transporter 1-like [Salvia divinorum]|uniref:Lysine histidine transporter 1-like n=1 Tax=Salvia divinorum TaxID=28513 RepID=A0ABD1HA48_SALDI